MAGKAIIYTAESDARTVHGYIIEVSITNDPDDPSATTYDVLSTYAIGVAGRLALSANSEDGCPEYISI